MAKGSKIYGKSQKNRKIEDIKLFENTVSSLLFAPFFSVAAHQKRNNFYGINVINSFDCKMEPN